MAATFIRNAKGQFIKDANIFSMFYGEGAYLLENELNEMQWNVLDKSSLLMNNLLSAGLLSNVTVTVDTDDTFYVDTTDKAIYVSMHGYAMAIGANTVASQSGALLSNDNRIIVKLNPSTVNRTDLVVLETWTESISFDKGLTKFGGESTDLIPSQTYNMLDPRINAETARRYVWRWRIRVVDDQNDLANVNAINHQGIDSGKKYVKNGTVWTITTSEVKDDNGNHITDGQIHAIPLFTVVRKPSTAIDVSDISSSISTAKLLNYFDKTESDARYIKGDSGSGGGAQISGNLTIDGDLTVTGNTTTINTTELNISDNIIRLNNDYTGDVPTENAGIEVERGTQPNVAIRWNESSDTWEVTTDGTNYFKIWQSGNDGLNSGLDADLLQGYVPGNASGNIPLSNGTLNVNLNAEKVSGKTLAEIRAGIDAELLDGKDSTYFTNPMNILQTASYRFATDVEKAAWNGKQNYLGYIPVNQAGDAMGGALTVNSTITATGTLTYGPTASKGVLSYNTGVITLESISANTSIDLRASGTGIVKINGNTAWHSGNDGAGSGLDSDLLDGLDSTKFMRTDQSTATNGNITVGGDVIATNYKLSGNGSIYGGYNNAGTNNYIIRDYNNGDVSLNARGANLYLGYYNTTNIYAGNTSNIVWHSGNDGANSGLDADLLDGIQLTGIWANLSGTRSGDINFKPAVAGGNVGIAFSSNVNAGGDNAYIRYYDDNNAYAYWGDSTENGALIIGAGDDPKNASSDVVVLKSPASVIVDTGELRVMNANGYLTLGSQNAGFFHFITDRDSFYFNKQIKIAGDIYAGATYDKLVWHSGNDGSGSGLDADLLDGQDGTYYTNPANIIQTASYRFVSDAEKSTWNNKQDSITLTSSKVAVTDVNGKLTTSPVGVIEVGYLSGVTSNVQTQLNGKAPTVHIHDDRYYTEGESDSRFTARTSAGRPGVTKLYRRDSDDAYNLQHHWTNSYWYLRGYTGDTFHAEVQVGYANYAENANTLDGIDSSTFMRKDQDNYTSGYLETGSYFRPSAGGGNNGIIFPDNPGGGSGDGAYIKYYSKGGDSMRLEIGISNDADDDIMLYAAGPIYLRSGSNYIDASNQLSIAGNIYSGGSIYAGSEQWFRSRGSTGLYWENWGGGLNMSDSTWVRVYNGKSFIVPGTTKTGRFVLPVGTNMWSTI